MILVISQKNFYSIKRLTQEAKEQKVSLDVLSVEELKKEHFKIDISKYQTLYIRNPYFKGGAEFLPQVIALAKKFRAAGQRVVDANIAHGNLGIGKGRDYQILSKYGLSIPKTTKLRSFNLPITYPLVLKWIYGFKAENVFLVRDQNQLKKILPMHPKKDWLAQEFIEADYEYKVVTIGYKAFPTILRFKTNSDGFGLDFDSGRSMPLNSKSIAIVKLAERASKVLGRELAKVDILQKGKQLYILEVNRFPGLENFEQATKSNIFKAFIEYLQK